MFVPAYQRMSRTEFEERALLTASKAGLRLPIVYNCGGYESLGVLRLLDGIVDIYA